jgi:protocatechuate 3,4-dioxygenase beta subunit
MKGAILLLAISACLRAQQGSLEGTAIHAVTREPLGNVHVRLVAASFNGITGAYGAMSDRTGHFSIATIRPGTYILLPERAGYLHVQAKGSTGIPNITIKAGEHLTGYQLEMTPRALISGRVVDEAGDPVQGVRVQTVAVTTGNTPVVMMPAPNPATDDRGEFRLTGLPGKYYVQATVNASGNGAQERPEIRSDGTSEAIYATTFYPSSLRKDRGTVVEAVAGKEVGGIEIRLARQQQGLSISGVVGGFPDGQSRGYVAMQFGESAQRITTGRSTTPAVDGKFRFDGLQPGFYRVWAVYNDGGKTQMASRTMEWQLENSEITNVELTLVPGVELSGTVRMEGEAVGAATKRTVKLEPAMGYFLVNLGMTGGEVDGDGAFRIANIAPAKYRVKVAPLPENAYIKTLEIDGVAANTGLADLSKVARTASARMTVGGNGAQISGRVLDASGEPMPTNVVMIFLARDAEDIPQVGNGTAQATPDGKYTIKAIVPGKYRLFALDAFQIAGGGNEIDVFKKLFERGEEIEFQEGDRITKDLKIIPVEDPNAKPKK